jgi:protein-S-isoprenylcysteine O-methyltransferase Ste14
MTESPVTPDPLPPATPEKSRLRAMLRTILVASLIGAAVGAWMTRGAKPQPPRHLLPASPMAICFYLWILLSVYWSIQARKISVAKSAESASSRGLHLLMISAAQLLVLWPYPGWPFENWTRFAFPQIFAVPAWLAALGVGVAALGLVIAVWARHQLGRNWSGEVTVKVDHELVRSGPYRRIRHPIYTGAILMYIGPALVSGRLQGPIALALVAIAYARKVGQEETALRGEFGAAYDDYRRESWAVIPWIL